MLFRSWKKVQIREDGKLCWIGDASAELEGMRYSHEEEKYVVYEIVSGSYQFEIRPL